MLLVVEMIAQEAEVGGVPVEALRGAIYGNHNLPGTGGPRRCTSSGAGSGAFRFLLFASVE